MEIPFCIREYTNSMRSSNVDKCWPFNPEDKDQSLPSMDVRKFRWWSQELDRKGKQRSPKKRSITELFAMAPQITTTEITRSEGPNEDQDEEVNAPVQLERETIADDAEKVRKKKKPKGKKRKIMSESDSFQGDEVKQDTIKERKKRKKKLRKKKKLEIQIHLQPKFNAGAPELSKMKPCSVSSKEDHEAKALNQTTDDGTDDRKLREEPDEAFIPLISILKKCKKNKSHAKRDKSVTFCGVDAVLGPNLDKIACIADPSVPDSKNEDKDISKKCLIDLNEALPEPIDLNTFSEDYVIETFNSTSTLGSPKSDICYSSHETSSLRFNSPHKMSQTASDFNKNSESLMILNSDLLTNSMGLNMCTEQPQMVPQTVRLMGKDVTVIAADLKSVNTGPKAQETASSSHASCSYYSDGANNKSNSKLDSRSCLDMNFSTGQFTPGNYLAANYITANPGPVISFPVVPGFNIYHPQFPVVSPPMISFPLGSSVFPQPYGLNFSGFRDGSNNRDKSCRKTGFMN